MGNNVKLHLSPEESVLFEIMWSFETKEQFHAWLDGLPGKQQRQVARILDRLLLEVRVEVTEADRVEDVSQAKHLLMRFM